MNFLKSLKTDAEKYFRKLLKKSNMSFDFVRNSLFQRWMIAIVLCLILAIIMAPEFHVSEPQLQLGMIAPRNIKADQAFLVEDKQAAEQKKIEDAENVKPVYDFDSNLSEKIRKKSVKALAGAAERYQNSLKGKSPENVQINISELQKEKRRLEASLGIYLSSEEFYVLNESKFSDDIQQMFSRLIVSFYDDRFITNDTFGKSEKQKGIVVRNLKTKTKEEIKDPSLLLNIQEIDETLQKKVNMVFRDESSTVKETAFSVVKKLIEPNLSFNKEETQKKRLSIIGDANPTFFQVQKNEMIVRE
ncbi:MAG TPA: hypothetical protein DIT25_04350, partial [Candidatus Moranbacteria bacterium]|nr:hypothetical protein [Candidatus Moranbacteria bacterium]